jgi:hypothetical protein
MLIPARRHAGTVGQFGLWRLHQNTAQVHQRR